MLDRQIPYFNMILKCSTYQPEKIHLPENFSFRYFQPGDEKNWARLEYEIGDFASPDEAEEYFKETYGKEQEELRERCVFLINEQGDAIGSGIAWRDKRKGKSAASLHWLVVDPAYQGRKLGKALCRKVMEIFWKKGEFPVYLHTQPWSWKAVLLYLRLGFRLQKEDTFADYENQYQAAMETLKNVLNEEQYRELLAHSEDGR